MTKMFALLVLAIVITLMSLSSLACEDMGGYHPQATIVIEKEDLNDY